MRARTGREPRTMTKTAAHWKAESGARVASKKEAWMYPKDTW